MIHLLTRFSSLPKCCSIYHTWMKMHLAVTIISVSFLYFSLKHLTSHIHLTTSLIISLFQHSEGKQVCSMEHPCHLLTASQRPENKTVACSTLNGTSTSPPHPHSKAKLYRCRRRPKTSMNQRQWITTTKHVQIQQCSCTYEFRGCSSIHKTCAESSQTKSQPECWARPRSPTCSYELIPTGNCWKRRVSFL